MKRVLPVFFLAGLLFAADFPQGTYKDQKNRDLKVDARTQILLYSAEKDVSAKFHEHFEKHGQKWMDKHGIVYLTDMTAVPQFVMKTFMAPKIKKYSYSMGIITNKAELPDIPLKPFHATLVIRGKDPVFIRNYSEMVAVLAGNGLPVE